MDFLKGKKWILQFQANNDLSMYNMKEIEGIFWQGADISVN